MPPTKERGRTPRRKKICQLLAEGYNIGQVGGKMSLSYRCVTRHLTELRREMRCKSNIQLVALLAKRGLL